jgi:chemotaxis protein MotB
VERSPQQVQPEIKAPPEPRMTTKKVFLIKKKVQANGHHGGAWKVAYADFVTAMMALFIVLWLMNTSDHIRQAVAGYFNDPSGTSALTGNNRSGSGENLPITRDNIADLKQRLEAAIRRRNDLKALSDQVQITITPDGLRIELLESKKGTFFDSGSAALNQNGRELLMLLAQKLGSIPNSISIEGHTDSQPYALSASYGNWELSSDRANAARRVMQASGLRQNQIAEVRGYADQQLRVPSNPLDPSNRRISLIVQYMKLSPAASSGGNAPAPSPPVLKPSVPSPAVQPKPTAATTVAARLAARFHLH